MIVPRNSVSLANPLIFSRRFDDCSRRQLAHGIAVDLLPGRLILRNAEAPLALQLATASVQFRRFDQNVRFSAPEIDAHAVAASEERKSPTRSGFG
jgi:hypothetical protein